MYSFLFSFLVKNRSKITCASSAFTSWRLIIIRQCIPQLFKLSVVIDNAHSFLSALSKIWFDLLNSWSIDQWNRLWISFHKSCAILTYEIVEWRDDSMVFRIQDTNKELMVHQSSRFVESSICFFIDPSIKLNFFLVLKAVLTERAHSS